jgi:hypothetical protein
MMSMNTMSKHNAVVAICDPRLFRKFIDVAVYLHIGYSVPDSLEREVSASILVADSECVEQIKAKADRVYLINEANIYRTALALLGKDKVQVLTVGIDPGGYYAYVVLADDIVIANGYREKVTQLLDDLRSLISEIDPKKVAIKVGYSSDNRVMIMVEHLLKELSKVDFPHDVILISERGTNLSNPIASAQLSSRPGKIGGDVYAALNIALKR